MTETDDLRRLRLEAPGGIMAGLAFGPEAANPDIVFLHATGFNARTYRSVLAPMGDKFSIWAMDARGHGRTELPANLWGYTSWRRHRDDLIALLEKHTTKPVTLAGHSMGATVSLLVAARRPDLVASLALLEPVIMPAAMYAAFEAPFGPLVMRAFMPLARSVLRRRAHFESREAARSAFTGRGVFKTFPADALADYVADGLVEDAKKGGVTLACAPAYEAATYCAQRHDPWGALRRVRAPIVLLRGEHNSTVAPAVAHRIAALKPEARVALVEGSSHMMPLERPDRARAAIEAATLMARGGRTWRDDVE